MCVWVSAMGGRVSGYMGRRVGRRVGERVNGRVVVFVTVELSCCYDDEVMARLMTYVVKALKPR